MALSSGHCFTRQLMVALSFQVLRPETLVSSTPQFQSHPICDPPANIVGSSFQTYLKCKLTSHSRTPPTWFKTPSFLTGCPAFTLRFPQYILNIAATETLLIWKSYHITPLLKGPDRFPISLKEELKVTTMVYKALWDLAHPLP